MTITRKRPRARTTVAEMTTDELRQLLEGVIDHKLSEWASAPRIARRRAEIAAHAAATRAEYRANRVRRGSAREVMAVLE
ncbi:MAG: hypothetical protein FJ009_20570 [Chloroflexi bacterium]|nr:hypothetical protein [Chloroflexota bacterium]